MFTVKGIPILYNEYELLEILRQDVFKMTGREILAKMKKTTNNISVCCPVHNEGRERRPSCGILTVPKDGKPAGTAHCFACGYVDSLEGFVSRCFGYEDNGVFGERWLMQNFVSPEQSSRLKINYELNRHKTKEEKHYILEEELSSYRFYHPYMYQRKLTNEIIEKYDVGYQKDFKFNEDWQPTEVITFPVRDKNGNCLFVSRRAIYNKTFFLPQDLEKPVYGIYELPKDCKTVIICESVINALTCVAYGKPAVALFGTSDSEQIKTLNSLNVRKYILALDPDKAGIKGTYRLLCGLKNKIVTQLVIPQGKDINDLSYEEFMNLNEIYLNKENLKKIVDSL